MIGSRRAGSGTPKSFVMWKEGDMGVKPTFILEVESWFRRHFIIPSA
jgi:hypothetical protein